MLFKDGVVSTKWYQTLRCFPLVTFGYCEAQAVALQSFLQHPCSWAEVMSIEKKR